MRVRGWEEVVEKLESLKREVGHRQKAKFKSGLSENDRKWWRWGGEIVEVRGEGGRQ